MEIYRNGHKKTTHDGGGGAGLVKQGQRIDS